MAAEAEASREARAKVVSANGEMKASLSLKTAADTINKSPVAIQLRYLQTLTHIAAEKNSTIIFPVPIELLSHFVNIKGNVAPVKSLDERADSKLWNSQGFSKTKKMS